MPPILYHYTDAAGLLGILTTRKLWATDIFYLNDSSELEYAFDVFRAGLGDGSQLVNQADASLSEIGDALAGINSDMLARFKPKMRCYVASFCKRRDLLSQWRGYSRGDAGYAIGFDTTRLVRIPGRLRQVEYDRDNQAAVAREYVVSALDTSLSQIEPEAKISLVSVIYEALVNFMVEVGPTFKNSAFAEEDEWRLLRVSGQDQGAKLLFRPVPYGISPYVELDLAQDGDLLPILEVICGPSRHPELSVGAVQMMLRDSGFQANAVSVVLSEIPLRQ